MTKYKVLVHPLGINSVQNVSRTVFLFIAITQVQALMTLFCTSGMFLTSFCIFAHLQIIQFQGEKPSKIKVVKKEEVVSSQEF